MKANSTNNASGKPQCSQQCLTCHCPTASNAPPRYPHRYLHEARVRPSPLLSSESVGDSQSTGSPQHGVLSLPWSNPVAPVQPQRPPGPCQRCRCARHRPAGHARPVFPRPVTLLTLCTYANSHNSSCGSAQVATLLCSNRTFSAAFVLRAEVTCLIPPMISCL